MAQPYLGLDIGANTIKAVELTKKKHECIITNAYLLQMPQGVVENGDIKDFADAASQLKKLISAAGFAKKPIALAIKGQSTIARAARVPFISPEQLKRDLLFTSCQYMQVDPHEFTIDYEILHTDKTNSQALILFEAVKKGVLSDYVSVVKSADLELGIVDMEVYALSNLYNALDCSVRDTSLLVHTGHYGNTVIMIKDGYFSYTETFSSGGLMLNSLLSSLANMTEESAGIVKANMNASEDISKVKNIISSNYLPVVLKDIQKAVEDYALLGGRPPVRGFLSGGAATLEGLRERLTEEYKFDFLLFDPSGVMKVDSNVAAQIFETRPGVLNSALGMALREN